MPESECGPCMKKCLLVVTVILWLSKLVTFPLIDWPFIFNTTESRILCCFAHVESLSIPAGYMTAAVVSDVEAKTEVYILLTGHLQSSVIFKNTCILWNNAHHRNMNDVYPQGSLYLNVTNPQDYPKEYFALWCASILSALC